MDTLAHGGRFIQNNSKIFLVDQTNHLHEGTLRTIVLTCTEI